jgi:mannose-6-phosphate isomerase-like protein (cupin superfamily)
MTADDSKRSGVRIYRAAEAPDLTQTDFGAKNDFGDHTELQDTAFALAAAAHTSSRLLVRQSPEEGGFSLVYLFFKPNFPLFRHRHESDCLYVVVSGSAVMGNQTLRAGDCFFVPATAPYSYTAGPEGIEVLEVRHNVDSFTTIYASNPPSALEQAKAAIEANGDAWQQITTGPLLRANAGSG